MMKNKEIETQLYKVMKYYRDVVAVELLFCSYLWIEGERPFLNEDNLIKRMEEAKYNISSKNTDNDKIIESMRQLRQEVTTKMELLTTYLERMICYNQVFEHMECKYLDEKKVEENVTNEKVNQLIHKIMEYIVYSKDNAVMNDKIRTIISRLPVRMTKVKFYDRLKEVVNLYLGDEQFILDGFIYRVKSAGNIFEPKDFDGKYEEFDALIKKLNDFDYMHSDKETFFAMQKELDFAIEKIREITDGYYLIQETNSLLYATAISNQYITESSVLYSNAMKAIHLILEGDTKEDLLIPFEGVLEEFMKKSYDYEKIMSKIEQLPEGVLKSMGLEQQYKDASDITIIISKNLFVNLEEKQNTNKVDKKYIEVVLEELIAGFDKVFKNNSKCVCRIIMAKVMEQLPMMFKNIEELERYIEQAFFNCQDKAEKMAVMQALEGEMDDTLV